MSSSIVWSGKMENFSHISYLELLVVACGFLTLQYLQIVLMTRYGLSDSKRNNDDSFPRRKYAYQTSTNNAVSPSRRTSYSISPSGGHSKRRGRRTFGIKHL